MISATPIAQIKHSFTNVIEISSKKFPPIEYNVWYKSIDSEQIFHLHFFKNNPIGVKKAVELAEEICVDNSLDFGNPYKDKSYLASFVKSMNDYENINLSISTGGSIIEKMWFKTNSDGKISLLTLKLNEESYIVSILNPR